MKIAAKSATESAAHRRANAPEMPMAVGNGYENNLHAIQAEHSRQAYVSDYALLQQLQQARAEGVLEVTFRTRTSTVTVPIDYKAGRQMLMEAIDVMGIKLDELENDIVKSTQDSEQEDEGDEEGESGRAKALAFCMPMRRLSDAEFYALPSEAQRAYESYGETPRFTDEEFARQAKGGLAA